MPCAVEIEAMSCCNCTAERMSISKASMPNIHNVPKVAKTERYTVQQMTENAGMIDTERYQHNVKSECYTRLEHRATMLTRGDK